MTRNFKIIKYLSIFILYSFVALFGYWTFYPYNPLEIEYPIEVLTPIVAEGEMVYVNFDFQKNTKIKPDISMALVDGIEFALPSHTPINIPGTTSDKIVGILKIPTTIPCGQYYISFSADYQMNPIRIITVDYQTEVFIINSTLCGEKELL